MEMRVIGAWVEPGSRVLDLGCGRGVLLEYLVRTKNVVAVGVDYDLAKISAAIKRGLTVYQGDLESFLAAFPDGHFDRVVCSRTLEELVRPARVINEALRVGRRLTIGFVNHGFWKNRVFTAFRGRKLQNEVYRSTWAESRPANPVTVHDFESFCAESGLIVRRKSLLSGNWRTPCTILPNLMAGYAVYELSR